MTVDVVEYTDPGCSWAWGSEPTLRRLRWRHGDRLRWRRVMGGLVGDMRHYLEDFDSVGAAPGFARYWAHVAATTGMPWPVRLARMYASTEPACVAVAAAGLQGAVVSARVLRRLREATFVFGEPPDTPGRIADAVRGVDGLDVARLAVDAEGEAARRAFRADWDETRAPDPSVMTLDDEGEGSGRAKHTEGHWRYVFPTLVFVGPRGRAIVAGWKPYERYEAALESVAPGGTADPRPDPTPEEAFRRWPALAPRELEVLCGGDARRPADAVRHDWGAGEYWLTAAEARARGIG